MTTPLPFTRVLLFVASLAAQAAGEPLPDVPARITEQAWDASWIAPADIEPAAYGVYHFRKVVHLDRQPDAFVVHISADNRYRLFVNGVPVNIGPARGDLEHWRFDTLDLARHLQAGANTLAVQVWNFGVHRPVAQISRQTALVIQGNTPAESVANTDTTWRAFVNPAYAPLSGIGARLRTYIVVGPGDEVDGSRYPWGWENTAFDDTDWDQARIVRNAEPRGTSTDALWLLEPRVIPLKETAEVRWHKVRRARNISVSEGFLNGSAPLTVPAHSRVSLLLDQNEITTAYPEFHVSGGKGSVIDMTYAEAPYEGDPAEMSGIKGHRDELAGKHIRGFPDRWRPDGGAERIFRPLRWRTYRYVKLDIETRDDPLVINDLRGEFTAYPFAENASFSSDDDELAEIWDLSWRTLRIGSHEIFTDSPYYEQLSYVGDSRIEALVSLYVSGDDRLMRKTIKAFDDSRNANGLTGSRYPDSRHQLIPPYSLVWINMVHDYWTLRDDEEFVADRLAGVREVLRFFEENSDPASGSYTGRRWWNFVDWIPDWGRDPVTRLGGVPPRDANGSSAILDLQYVLALQHAAELMREFGHHHDADRYEHRAALLRASTYRSCWDATQGLLADTAAQDTFSQHANALFILTDNGEIEFDRATIGRLLIEDPSLTEATFYFQFYIHEAIIAAGLGERYLELLDAWRALPDMGLTTVPERPWPDTRSDAHAWGSHPMLFMLNSVGGIRPGSAGFKTVKITPHLGELTSTKAQVPHPNGNITVELERASGGRLHAIVTLPPELEGHLQWGGTTRSLTAGETSEFTIIRDSE